VRRLQTADVRSVGGDPDLAAFSFAWRESLRSPSLPGLVQIVGTGQPTIQSVSLELGTARGNEFTYSPGVHQIVQQDCSGDGTVPRESAQLPQQQAFALPQTHGALGKSPESATVAEDALVHRQTGPWMGAPGLGLRLPDMVDVGQVIPIRVRGAEQARGVSCLIVDLQTGRQIASPPLRPAGDELQGRFDPPRPGLYRVSVTTGGMSSTSEIVMAAAPEEVTQNLEATS
jgi:hypothetical protein